VNNTESDLGWLHITDIHVGQPREGGRLANIERAFLEDVAKVIHKEKLVISAIFLTGDVAFRGAEAEYVRASALLGRICAHIHEQNLKIKPCDPPVLVPVPGNHDLARPPDDDARTIRDALKGRRADSPPLWSPGQTSVRDLVDRCFADYRAWLRHPLPFPRGPNHGLLPGDLCTTITRGGVSVGILGLNSAVLHLGDAAPGSMHLDLSQVTHLIGHNPRGWIEAHHFNLLMTHHPPAWLSEPAQQILREEIRPDALFDLHLYGHEHAGRFAIEPGSSGVRHLVEGRSLFGAEDEGSSRVHGYTVGRFVLEAPSVDGLRKKRVEVWTRQGWRDGHGWHFGPGDERLGRWKLHIELGETSAPITPDSPAPAVPPVGLRRDEWTPIEKADDLNASLSDDPERRWILLSASIPVPHADPERRERERTQVKSARPDAIVEFVRELIKHVAKPDSKLGIIFGGHPSISRIFAARALDSSSGTRWLTLVQDEAWWHGFIEEVSGLASAKAVRPCLVRHNDPSGNLGLLRDAMLTPSNLIAAVFIGGLSGVKAEFDLAGKRRPEVPRYAVGVGGGAAAELLLDQERDATGGPGHVAQTSLLWHTPESAVMAILKAIEGPNKP
jgi:hypothetical protein